MGVVSAYPGVVRKSKNAPANVTPARQKSRRIVRKASLGNPQRGNAISTQRISWCRLALNTPQRVSGVLPDNFVGVFEGSDEGWYSPGGSWPDIRQRVGGAPPDRFVGVFEGGDEGWHGFGGGRPDHPQREDEVLPDSIVVFVGCGECWHGALPDLRPPDIVVGVFGGGDECWYGDRPDLHQRAGNVPPEIFAGVFEGGDEGWHGLSGSRAEPPQHVGDVPPDAFAGVFKGGDEGWHGFGGGRPRSHSA